MEDNRQFEWLTFEICNEYKAKADSLPWNDGQDTGEWRKLREELQNRCNLREIEAYNILRGYNIRDYVNKYDILSGRKPIPERMRQELEKANKVKGARMSKEDLVRKQYEEKLDEYENRIAELESNKRYSGYYFEEKE